MNKYSPIIILSAVLLSACATKEIKPVVHNEIARLKSEIEQYRESVATKRAIKTTIEDIKQNKVSKNQPIDEFRFDVKTDQLPAVDFFMNMMAGTGKNIVVHPDVEGNITLQLNSVTLGEVLNVVRDVYGFDHQYNGNIYTILPRTLRTEIFPINYLNVKRVGVSDTSVLTGNIESSSQSSSNNSANSLSGEGGNIQPGSRIQTRSETDFWTSLNRSLSELVGVDDNTPLSVQNGALENGSVSDNTQRRVITNPQTGVAIVTAMPSELSAVRHFLEKTSLSVKRQVIIEAKILEVQLSNSQQTGINWNAINGHLLLGKNASEFDTGVNITELSEGVGEVFSSLVRISDVRTLLSLLETQGELQVLSSPRVSTVNNQKAVIRVGSDRFFVTGISSSTVSNASSTTSSPDIELSSFFSGISLDVTPQISEDGGVILHIHPVISSVTEEQKNIVVGDEAFSLPLALRDIRESDSIVKAESGQVIVLGGLMQERINNINGQRPGLSKVPIAGELFKTQQDERVKSELVILLKPIVIEKDSWVDDFNNSQKRFSHLNENKKTSATEVK